MEAREIIEAALKATGLTVDELAARLDYKSLKRAMWGEIPLPDSKRKHIADIVRLHELEARGATTEYVGSPREKLKAALIANGLTPAALARKISYDAGIVENVVNGGGRISEAMAEKIVATLDHGLTVAELLDGSETPRVIDASGRYGTHGAKPLVDLPGGKKTRFVPLLSWAAAGALTGAAALDEAFDGEAVASTVPGRVFAVEISGDSMYPEINPGDYAVVRADTPARPGQVVLVRTIHGDVLCKRYTTKDREKLVILSSVNNSYQPIEIPASEIAWIYPVKQVIRNY